MFSYAPVSAFVSGHPLLGIADAITETYLMVLVITASIVALSGAAENIPVVVILGIILALEKIMTVYHSNHFIKEFIPKDRSIEILTTVPEAQYPEQVKPEPKPEEILSPSWRSN